MKIKCGICGRRGLLGGAVLHPRTRRPTTRCSKCREGVCLSRPKKDYKPLSDSTKQEENL